MTSVMRIMYGRILKKVELAKCQQKQFKGGSSVRESARDRPPESMRKQEGIKEFPVSMPHHLH